MSDLTLSLLGPPRLERDGAPINIQRRKAVALLAYLAVAGSQGRDTLAALLWPESDQAHARSTLRRTLSSLNKALDGEGLAIDREHVGLEPGDSLWVDVHEFRGGLAAWKEHGHPEANACPDCLGKGNFGVVYRA